MIITTLTRRTTNIFHPCNIKYNYSIKRTLMKSIAGSLYARATHVTKFNPNLVSKRGDTRHMAIIPKKFQPSFSKEKCHDRDQQDISWHEGSHVILYDDKTNKVVGLLTSSHGKDLPPGVYHAKISSEKYDNSFIPLKGIDPKDPKKKIDLLDSNGNKIQIQIKEGNIYQYFLLNVVFLPRHVAI